MPSSESDTPVDPLLAEIADYVCAAEVDNEAALAAARWCLLDSLGCALLALRYPACTRLLGPVVPGAVLPGGARVPGTALVLEPVRAAFNIGTMIRWLDFNDTWLAAEWGHPSDNLGGLLAAADYLCRLKRAEQTRPLAVRDLLEALIKAYEVHGVLALENCFNARGLDHVVLVRVATAATVTALFGTGRREVIAAVSNAWLDGAPLRAYRHAPMTGPRKGWAAGDATSRGLWLALMALEGEPGYPQVLSAPRWGLQDVIFGGEPLRLGRPLGTHVVENILFKVGYPAEFHGQTAVEAAVQLHPQVADRLDRIEWIVIETQAAGKRIIDKSGPLANPADRDHCLQYMVAVALSKGALSADDYEDRAASDPVIDRLRGLMEVRELARFSADYADPDKRAIANAVQIFFRDGTATERIEVGYPLGHPRRREEALPLLEEKARANLSLRLPAARVRRIMNLFANPADLDPMPVDEFVSLFATESTHRTGIHDRR